MVQQHGQQRRRRTSPRWRCGLVVLLSILLPVSGCRQVAKDRAYVGDAQPAEYVGKATAIKYPDVIQQTAAEVTYSTEPRRLRNRQEDEIWDLSLQEAIHLALSNNRVIRSAGTFLSPGNPLLANPDGATTVYDPALQSTGTLFSSRGVDAALSEFDTQFSTAMIWGKSETIQNNAFNAGGLTPGSSLNQDTADFTVGLAKRMATGAQFGVSHQWNYSANNTPARLFPSVYEGNVRAQLRQPLLAGAGVDYTRIAGPISENIDGVTGVRQGVLIARINNDMALADFEQSVHTLLHDVEQVYWQLVLAYQSFHVQAAARDEVLEMWRKVDIRLSSGAAGGGRLPEAEVRESYVRLEAAADTALDQVYAAEAQLRRLLALPVNDGRVIRPCDDPITAEIIPDWVSSLSIALAQRPELRRQKWNIKSTQLQLQAAHSLLLPRLDLVGSAQVNGFGDDLLGDNGDITGNNLGNAYDRLLSGKNVGWNIGVEFSTPVGRRFAHTQVRNLELELAKGRTTLHQQEVEVSHELAAAFRDVDRTYLAMQSAYNRIDAAKARVDAVLDRTLPDDLSLDPLLRAREGLLQAQLQYLTGVTDYNTALADLHFRAARTLEVNNVALREGPWNTEAHADAERRFAARQHAFDAPWKSDTVRPFERDVPAGEVLLPAIGAETEAFPTALPPDSLPDAPPVDDVDPGVHVGL
ncbi:MAG: TolC family protein [Planctomycetaceae bacterium]|nr:TolC family protein [Planctomycetaceae bacterium]